MNHRNLGLAGAALLFVGVFLPIVRLPFVGSQNYFQNGKGDGVFLVILALFSALLALSVWRRWLIATGGLSLAYLLFSLYRFSNLMSEMKASMETELKDNPFAGLATAMVGAVELQWGWAVLIVASVMIVGAGAMREA
jgi:hypothetical protein